jgi:hypothetical protein
MGSGLPEVRIIYMYAKLRTPSLIGGKDSIPVNSVPTNLQSYSPTISYTSLSVNLIEILRSRDSVKQCTFSGLYTIETTVS